MKFEEIKFADKGLPGIGRCLGAFIMPFNSIHKRCFDHLSQVIWSKSSEEEGGVKYFFNEEPSEVDLMVLGKLSFIVASQQN